MVAVAASLLPPTSPVMPVGAAATEVSSWQLLLSVVVLLLAATYGVIRLAGCIYAGRSCRSAI